MSKLRARLYRSVGRFLGPRMRQILMSEKTVELSHWREVKLAIQRAFGYAAINGLNGCYYEFGLFQGNSLSFALTESRRYAAQGTDIRIHGFDSFQGLPEPEGERDDFFDGQGSKQWVKGSYACPKAKVIERLADDGFPEDSYELHEGFFEDSLTPELISNLPKAAIVHIDCDYYKSTKTVLWAIQPLLQQGTVVIFDDYFCYQADSSKGEALALNEFREAFPGIELIPWYNHHCVGKSFLVDLTES